MQLDFVTKVALIAATNAWLLDRTKPLGDILRAQGALDACTLGLLDALVRKHLAQHGDDPQQSLAAVSSLGSLRDQLQSIADPDVRTSLAVAATRNGHPPAGTLRRAPQPTPPTRRPKTRRAS